MSPASSIENSCAGFWLLGAALVTEDGVALVEAFVVIASLALVMPAEDNPVCQLVVLVAAVCVAKRVVTVLPRSTPVALMVVVVDIVEAVAANDLPVGVALAPAEYGRAVGVVLALPVKDPPVGVAPALLDNEPAVGVALVLVAKDRPAGVALVLVANMLAPDGVVVLTGGADHVCLAAGDFIPNGDGPWSAAAAGDFSAEAAGDGIPELNAVERLPNAGLRRLVLLALAAPNMAPPAPAAGERQLLVPPSAVDAPVGVADVDDVPLLKKPGPER